MIAEGFDGVVRSGDIEDSRLTSRLLGSFRMLLVGAPEYFAHYGKPMHPRELSLHACIQFRMPNTGKLQSWQLRREVDEPDHQLLTKMTCNTNELACTLRSRAWASLTCRNSRYATPLRPALW